MGMNNPLSYMNQMVYRYRFGLFAQFPAYMPDCKNVDKTVPSANYAWQAIRTAFTNFIHDLTLSKTKDKLPIHLNCIYRKLRKWCKELKKIALFLSLNSLSAAIFQHNANMPKKMHFRAYSPF